MPDDIEQLNIDCTCITLDHDRLCAALTTALGDEKFCRDFAATHPHLVSAQPLFLTADHATQMQRIIHAIEKVAELSVYREAILAYAPEIARFRPGPAGVFMGYDFHLGSDGPKLIEINTNAGGALINAYVLQAQLACCAEMALSASINFDLDALLSVFVESFRSEWLRQGRTDKLQSVAIVDQDPQHQYLYPEFRLFERLFEQHGINAVVVAPEQLASDGRELRFGRQRIDLVYNRLTDFDLSQPGNRQLRSAYVEGDVVVTPNPWAHAHFADKRNLIALSDEAKLREWDVEPDLVATLVTGIPRTVLVTPYIADELWARRGKLFFKPCSGYGSKAAYRGDKLTRKVWSEIVAASYVAQDIVPPITRTISINSKPESMKADLRCYTYLGHVQLVAARLYQGQTTNFRTPGGGFAPVFIGQRRNTCVR